MSDYTFFTVEQYGNVSILTWTESAATRVLRNGELRVEMRAFVVTTKPHCVIVRFAQLRQCPSSLIGGLIGLNGQLKERGGRLKLCEMDQLLREQFDRLHLDSVFEIHGSLSEAITACEVSDAEVGQHDETTTED